MPLFHLYQGDRNHSSQLLNEGHYPVFQTLQLYFPILMSKGSSLHPQFDITQELTLLPPPHKLHFHTFPNTLHNTHLHNQAQGRNRSICHHSTHQTHHNHLCQNSTHLDRRMTHQPICKNHPHHSSHLTLRCPLLSADLQMWLSS